LIQMVTHETQRFMLVQAPGKRVKAIRPVATSSCIRMLGYRGLLLLDTS
jgi:hypothetical protein